MEPLAYRIRPNDFKDVIGQDHLIGENGVITLMLKNNRLLSMILYGNPGTGKTTIANIVAKKANMNVRHFNASIDNKAKLKSIVEEENVLLILDEIHRMKKDIQDFLLPHLESGHITMIGITTVSPYHSVNPAIRSRAHIYRLRDFNERDIYHYLLKISGDLDYILAEDVAGYISYAAGKEIRTALNMLESLMIVGEVNLERAQEIIMEPNLALDKDGDNYYELLSGLQKSIRGSDVNSSLHYLAKLIILEDLVSICRRLRVIAYEDIGLANPEIGPRVHAATESAIQLGLPEARIPLSVIVVDMALSPKSNSAYVALDTAIQDVKAGNTGQLPSHLKNKKQYKYPHSYPNALLKQRYFPTSDRKRYYEAKETGKYEKALKQRYDVIEDFFKK